MKHGARTDGRSRRSDSREAAGSSVVSESQPREEWFRWVADYTYDWESWLGTNGEAVWVNPAVERMTGCPVAECYAMENYPLPLVLEDDRQTVALALQDGQRAISGENVEFRVAHRQTGEVRWMSLCWQPMYGPGEQHLGLRTSIRDITERQQLKVRLSEHADELETLVEQRTQRLRQLERRGREIEKLAALGQLAAGVAHEINNPLAGIRNAFELIRTSLSPAHRHFELLELIDREIDRVSGIVHQMYQLYRRNPQATSEFYLERTVEEIAYLLGKVAQKHSVEIRCIPPRDPVGVKLPEGEVKQVLFNLMRNAIQASPAQSEVAVCVEVGEQEVSVHVKDFGAGISEQMLPLIFDPFFTTKHDDEHAGMGLGLSVSRSLIEAMGGRIEVDSRPGGGSLFSAVFPQILEPARERSDA